MNGPGTVEMQLSRAGRWALLVGVLGLGLCLVGAVRDPTQFFRSYLFAYVFWISFPLGCIAIAMVHHLTGGNWGFGTRRFMESAGRTLPLMAVLFLPVLVGLSHIYKWAQPAAVAADPMLQYKAPYLNVPFFVARSVFYFAVWIVLAYLLSKWSLQQDRTGEVGLSRRLTRMSAPGLVIYFLTVTFAMIDWVMSIEAHWFSTIYGMLFVVIEGLAGMAFVIVMFHLLSGEEPLSLVVTKKIFNDLGNLMLVFVMLWAYLAFSQFLIIWSGNLSDEIPWYTTRARGGWAVVAVILIVLHFGLPFLLLLSRAVKRRTGALATVAGMLILLSLVDIYWLTMPGFEPSAPKVHWTDLAAVVGIGGIWLAAFLWQLKGKSLLPLHDPQFAHFEGAVQHGD
jgi:hypothetical protein